MIDFIWNIPTVIDVISKIRNYFGWEIEKNTKRRKGFFHEFDNSKAVDCANIWKGLLGKDFFLSNNYWKDWKVDDNVKRIYSGDVICVHKAVLSRWVPVLPGQIFSTALKPLDKEKKQLTRYVEKEGGELEAKMFFDTEYKFKSGIASIRVLPRNGKYLLCCSNIMTFTGLPILIDERLYKEKILEGERNNSCIQANVECVITEMPSEWNKDLASFVPKELLKRYTLPKYYLELKSIHKIGDAPQCVAAAWSGFKANYKSSISETFKSSHFIINNGEDAIRGASQKVISYVDFLRSGLIGGRWQTMFDFDETRKWIPEKTFNPLSNDINEVNRAINSFYKNF
jgi:hypothetical protein